MFKPLKLKNFEITFARVAYLVEWKPDWKDDDKDAEAIIKVVVGEKRHHIVAEGYHPLLAFFRALRDALAIDFPLAISSTMCMAPDCPYTTELQVAESLDDLISESYEL